MFVNPIGFGVAITAGMLLAFTAVTLHLISLTPQLLGQATKCVDQNLLEYSGAEACKYFYVTPLYGNAKKPKVGAEG